MSLLEITTPPPGVYRSIATFICAWGITAVRMLKPSTVRFETVPPYMDTSAELCIRVTETEGSLTQLEEYPPYRLTPVASWTTSS